MYFSRDKDLILIERVAVQRELYDSSDKNDKNVVLRDRIWESATDVDKKTDEKTLKLKKANTLYLNMKELDQGLVQIELDQPVLVHDIMSKVPGSQSLPIHKTVLLGDNAVGKSALALRFIHNDFISTYEPSKTEVYKKKLVLDGEVVQINIVVTAGQEEYPALRNNFIKDGEGFVIVFSIADQESFNSLQKYRHDVTLVKWGNDIPMILVGNKCDLDDNRLVPTAVAAQLSRRWNVPYVETSAKYSQNVENVFLDLLRSIEAHKLSERSYSGQRRACCEIL